MFSRISEGWKIALQVALVLAACAAAIAILVSLGAMKSPANSHRLQFSVDASGGFAVITLQAGTTLIREPTTVTAPWSKTIRIESGTEVYLTASNPTATGKISCTILMD